MLSYNMITYFTSISQKYNICVLFSEQVPVTMEVGKKFYSIW